MSAVFNAFKNSKAGGKLLEWYSQNSGYRQLGLLKDDLIPDEHPLVAEAIRRLPRKDFYDRLYRFRRALNLSGNQDILPKELWVKPEQDIPYLQPILSRVELENETIKKYNQMVGIPEHLKNRNRC